MQRLSPDLKRSGGRASIESRDRQKPESGAIRSVRGGFGFGTHARRNSGHRHVLGTQVPPSRKSGAHFQGPQRRASPPGHRPPEILRRAPVPPGLARWPDGASPLFFEKHRHQALTLGRILHVGGYPVAVVHDTCAQRFAIRPDGNLASGGTNMKFPIPIITSTNVLRVVAYPPLRGQGPERLLE